MGKEKTSHQVPRVAGLLSTLDTLPKPSITAYSTLRTMRRDPTIALARWLVVAPILASGWSVEAEEDAPEGSKDFINEQMQPLRLHLLKTGMYGCLDFGWQPYEKVFKVGADGRVVIRKLKPLLQDTTSILIDTKTGAYVGLKNNMVPLKTAETLLLYIDVEGTDWYGQSLLENVNDPYTKWNSVNEAADRYDRKVAGSHWVVHYPQGTSNVNGTETDNFKVAQDLLQTLESSGAIAVPRQLQDVIDDLNRQQPDAWKIELLSDQGRGTASFIDRQKYLDALKVRGLGLPERAVLEGEFGTKAEAEAHADFAITNMEMRHRMIVQLVNWHLVNQLLRFNYGPDAENTVYVEPAPITDLALQHLRKVYDAILSSPEGFMYEMTSIDLEALKDRLGIPIRTDVDSPGYESDVQIVPYSDDETQEAV